MVGCGSTSSVTVVTGTATGSSESKHSGKGQNGEKFDINECVFFTGCLFVTKKVGFSRQVFINMKHVMLLYMFLLFFLLGFVCLSLFLFEACIKTG